MDKQIVWIVVDWDLNPNPFEPTFVGVFSTEEKANAVAGPHNARYVTAALMDEETNPYGR